MLCFGSLVVPVGLVPLVGVYPLVGHMDFDVPVLVLAPVELGWKFLVDLG